MTNYNSGSTYKLTPSEAQKLFSQGYVLIWEDNERKSGNHNHNKGEPETREYYLIGKW